MNIVSIEASSNICSVSSFKDSKLINLIETDKDRAHSKNLPIMIKRIMQDFSVKDKIHAFSISIGPGSFTSLRISLSLVKGISLILKNNIIPVPTFDYLNFQVNREDVHYIALSSFKDKCFIQKFKGLSSIGTPYIDSINNLKNIKEDIYSNFEDCNNQIEFLNLMPNSIYLAKYAIEKEEELLKKYNDEVKPIYLSNIKYEKNVNKSE